ncbi:MAG: hypothetical protein IJ104_07720 [Methanobrevibacter sp.]|nr:hypothetical protein [Methanobrevibacter sp.]
MNLADEMYNRRDLFESSTSSVKCNIYGRIYYSIFLYVREWLNQNTSYVSYPFGEHKRMPMFIKNKGPFTDEQNEEIFRLFNQLKKLRHQSDYYLEIPNKYSKMYEDWVFEDIVDAFEIADYIIECFDNVETNN